MFRIRFTREALERLTDAQKKRIIEVTLDNPEVRIDASVDFALPKGYIAVTLDYPNTTIYGGISSEGVMST